MPDRENSTDAEIATKARLAAFMSAIAPGAPSASDRKRPLETPEIAAILNLHIRAPRLPLLDPSTRDLDLSTEDFPHAMRNGVRIVESRRWVSLTLQLKTFDRARRSVALDAQQMLRDTRMKLALVPAGDVTHQFVSKDFSAKAPMYLQTNLARIFQGEVDATRSFAVAPVDAYGYCVFRFKVLFRKPGDHSKFCLLATPLDPHLQSSQLEWMSQPFCVKAQIRGVEQGR